MIGIVKTLSLIFFICYHESAHASFNKKTDFPPGKPGMEHVWGPALKEAIGTSYNGSKVWFTVAQGILTEVYYPKLDEPQLGDLQILVVDPTHSEFSEQKTDTRYHVSFNDPGMEVQINGESRIRSFSYEQRIVTDPKNNAVRIRYRIQLTRPTQSVYLLLNPALGNGGSNDIGSALPQALIATDPNAKRSLALLSSVPFKKTSVGYVGISDGWQILNRYKKLEFGWKKAGPGNVALTAEIARNPSQSVLQFELTLGFGITEDEALKTAQASAENSYESISRSYQNSWKNYSEKLLPLGKKARFSAVIVKMAEDKTETGALIASFGKPGLPSDQSTEKNTGGYHLVWPRDLYHSAMGLMAAGDLETPKNVIEFLIRRQREDGSWPQNFWLDGTPYWPAIQLDQIAFPILLADQMLSRKWVPQDSALLNMIQRAAEFIIKNGPKTEQDRWEEVSGYVPSSIGPSVRALYSAGRILGRADWIRIADEWNSKLEKWTSVHKGIHGNDYYIRNAPSGSPNTDKGYYLANGAGWAQTSEIIDGGFLHYVRFGLRSLSEQVMQNTLRIYDGFSTEVTGGRLGFFSYRRYNRDRYGPDAVGGFWPLLAAERGMAELVINRGSTGSKTLASNQLKVVESSALPSGLIPEQVIDAPYSPKSGELRVGLGVACPLTWAHAEHIMLTRSLIDGVAFDTQVWTSR